MLPIFLVSLEHHQNRRDKVFAGLQKYGINDAIWFPAVNGNKEDLSKFNIDRTKHQRFWHNSISCCSYNRVYTNGEYGCALSHLHLYQKIVDENIAVALIIEDDVVPLNADVTAFLENIKDVQEKTGFEILFLDYEDKLNSFSNKTISFGNIQVKRIGIPNWDWLFNRRKNVYRTSAYIITKEGAKKLLAKGYPVRMPADILSGLIAYNKLNAWKTLPITFIPTGEPSQLQRFTTLPENQKSWLRKNLTLKNIRRVLKSLFNSKKV